MWTLDPEGCPPTCARHVLPQCGGRCPGPSPWSFPLLAPDAGLAEWLEQLVDLIHRDAEPLVPHPYNDVAATEEAGNHDVGACGRKLMAFEMRLFITC
ncbi:MAG: hypothetical protein L7F78_23510 [Syntrophales bacterium LBB04]|nr:hypothetical protein [Syntrophales bacterium LBB04]